MGWRSNLRPSAATQRDEVSLGRIIGVFGVSGEVRVHLDNRESTLLQDGVEVVLQDETGYRAHGLVRTRPGSNGRVLAKIVGIEDRDTALELVDVEIFVPRTLLPTLEPGEYYLTDLIGMAVECDGIRVGEVVDIHDQGPVEVIELDGQRYLPSTGEHILSIDLEAGVLHVADGAVAF